MQELITMIQSVIFNIDQRKEQVKQFVIQSELKEEKRHEAFEKSHRMSVEAKRRLDLDIEDISERIEGIRKEIKLKYNKNIDGDIEKAERD